MNLLNRLNLKPFMAEDGAVGGTTEKATSTEDKVEAKAEAKEEPKKAEKTFTQDEVNAMIEKRLAREKAKAEEQKAEAEKLASMNAEEKLRYEYEKKNAELEAKLKEFNAKELKQESISILQEKGYSVESSRKLAELLNLTDAETAKASIETLDKVLKELIANGVDERIKNSAKTTPKVGVTSGAVTWNDVLANPRLMSEYKKQQRK